MEKSKKLRIFLGWYKSVIVPSIISAVLAIVSVKVGWGCIVKAISSTVAPISIAKAASPIKSPALGPIMPTLKTEILGSPIEINYEESEKDKLIKIIEKFNDRLLDFENLRGKISDKKILILAALKAEDQIIDKSLTE